MALGAARRNVVRMVLAQGARLAGAGILAGVPVALLATAGLRPFLFGVAPHDATVFAAIALLLLGVAALSCAVPAARAAHIDPAVALRDE
jgi:ABC-type antimicrobial peptide transport system permease subunit